MVGLVGRGEGLNFVLNGMAFATFISGNGL